MNSFGMPSLSRKSDSFFSMVVVSNPPSSLGPAEQKLILRLQNNRISCQEPPGHVHGRPAVVSIQETPFSGPLESSRVTSRRREDRHGVRPGWELEVLPNLLEQFPVCRGCANCRG
eukprot:GHVU01228991.1.p1 GENE.GHVU01228991.1~~GHVU01228991.1.p1  ORF type:complete len:116 (-),score=1.21 GHVU01228991.1:25-372(-)